MGFRKKKEVSKACFNQLLKEFNPVKLPEEGRFDDRQQNSDVTLVCADSLLGRKEVLRGKREMLSL